MLLFRVDETLQPFCDICFPWTMDKKMGKILEVYRCSLVSIDRSFDSLFQVLTVFTLFF